MRLFKVTRDWRRCGIFSGKKITAGSTIIKIGMRAATFCRESDKPEKTSNKEFNKHLTSLKSNNTTM
jgi:hypothetical protein